MYSVDCFDVILLQERRPLNQLYFLKSFVSILFAFLIFLVSNRECFIYLTFRLNQSYIATNLCVMKDEPINTCCGKCVLKKQLDESQKRDHSGTEPGTQKELIPLLFVCSKFPNYLQRHETIRARMSQLVPLINSLLLITGIFHPPRI